MAWIGITLWEKRKKRTGSIKRRKSKNCVDTERRNRNKRKRMTEKEMEGENAETTDN